MKRLLSGILILLILLAPLNTALAVNAQQAAATAAQFNPNVNFTSGNTYGGGSSPISISGIGGAIASCANIGGFLTSAAASLTSSLGGLVSKSASSYTGGGSAVSTSDSKTQSALATQNTTTQCLDGVAYAVAKNALAQITNKTLKWVNTGMNGNPLYVQNVNSYLGSIKTQQTNLFLSSVQSSDPIFGNALRSSITLGVTGKSDGLLNTPLNTPQAQSFASFQTDFTNGGWNALLNPAYNPVGAFFNAVDTLNTNVATQQQQASNEIQRNNGFLDMKQCVKYANNGAVTSPASNQCTTITSDSIYENCCTGQADEDSAACNSYATADAQAAGTPACASIPNDTVYGQCCGDGTGDSPMCIAYNTSSATDANATATGLNSNAAGVKGAPVCTQWSTTTPGSVISSQVQTVTNTPVQQLVYANKINEVLGSFFDSFVNNLLSKGLRGSGGSPTNVDGGYDSEGDNYISNTTTGSADLGYQASGSGDADTGDFDISRPQQLRAILQTQENFLNASLDAQTALERIVPSIGALDYCIPGPNPDWDNGLDSNWQSFISTVQQAPANSPSTLDNVLGALPVVGGIISAIMGNNTPPPVWIANAVLTDKATGNNIAMQRTFFDPSTKLQQSSEVDSGLNAAYQQMLSANQYGYFATTANSFDPSSTNTSTVGNAFVQASANDSDPSYVHGFLQDAYTYTDSLVNYNQSATAIDQTYDTNITATNNTVEQMTDIMNQVDQIVSTAKARYISQNPGVNVQCLDQAYIIDESPIVATPRIEPDPNNPLEPEEDAVVQHSEESASYFYSQIK